MLKKILVALTVLVGVFLVVVALQPSEFRVQREITMAVPAEVAFSQVNDFHKWDNWSPWAKKDPNAKNTFEGSPSGVGAALSWAGNMEVGEGKMTITESLPPSLIRIQLDFLKPFAGTSTAEFTFTPQGENTVVSWSMSGKNNFVAKAMSLIMSCDKMIGGEFEKGLAQMKTVAESAANRGTATSD